MTHTPQFVYAKFLIGTWMIFATSTWVSANDTLPVFLTKVQNTHPAVQQWVKAKTAAEQRREQTQLLTETHLNAQGQVLSETKPGNFSSFLGEETQSYSGQLGASGTWASGTQWRTGMQLTAITMPGANTSLVSQKEYAEGRLFAELTQPLWRDAWDTGLIRRTEQIQTASDAEIAIASFNITQLLVEAETAYWRHAVLAQLVEEATDAVSRAKALLSWTETRRTTALAQDNDVAQAKATLALRELELEQAKADWKQAAEVLSYWSKARVSDAIPADTQLLALSMPKKKQYREDLLAQMAAEDLARITTDEQREASKPNLALTGTLALNQREDRIGNVIGNSLSTRYPSIGLTMQLDIPLDGVTHQKLVESANTAWESEQSKTKALSARIDQGWTTVASTVASAKLRLTKAKALEKAQYTKWQLEAERHKKGRSTLAQVLTFEQDYANAQALVLRSKLDLLTALAQAKLFGE